MVEPAKVSEMQQNTLLLKKLPKPAKHFSKEFELLQPKPLQIKYFGRRRVLLSFDSAATAAAAQIALQQQRELFGANLQIGTFNATAKKRSKKTKTQHKSTQTHFVQDNSSSSTTPPPQISKYVQKLYACAPQLNFEQPPPPYLKYAYPRITPDILDAIGIALMSNTRFYTQVLHLMNRMNLEPPFLARQQTFVPSKEASTQTTTEIESKIPTESELETSSDDEAAKRQKQNKILHMKRKLPPSEEQFKRKARKLLQSVKSQGITSAATAAAIVEPATVAKKAKITLNLQSAAVLPALQLCNLQRLNAAQLSALPIYQNYQRGEPSCKLYIKNLAKTVTAEHLLQIYAHFASKEQLQVKLMQQGRMRGQAFVDFENVRPAEQVAAIVEQALNASNGVVLHDKPMLVCYGKK